MSKQRILFRAGKAPHAIVSNEASLGWRTAGTFGSNAGNMLFSESVYRTVNVPETEIVCDSYAPEWRTMTKAHADEVSERYDSYIVPLANAFRPGYGEQHLVRLTKFISELTIPVTVIGVGAQLPLSGSVSSMPTAVRENTKAFVSAVLDKSSSIGVRGEITRDVLLKLGFADSDIDVIGCPSMFARGAELTIKKESLPLEPKLAINLETNVDGIVDFYQANERAHPSIISVYQTLTGADLVMWGKTASGFAAGLPRSPRDSAYIEGRMRFFTSGERWRQFMATQDFAFGIRIHGNVSALSAETPAFMLTIDSRTQELAEYHEIPRAEFAKVMESGRYLAEDLYERADFSKLNEQHQENFARYVAFLDRNGIDHVHTEGKANPKYDLELAHADLPDGAQPMPVLSQMELASRISWLWQGREADRFRPVDSYKPDFELDATHVRQPGAVAQEAAKLAHVAMRQVEDQARIITRLTAQITDIDNRISKETGFRRFVRRIQTRLPNRWRRRR